MGFKIAVVSQDSPAECFALIHGETVLLETKYYYVAEAARQELQRQQNLGTLSLDKLRERVSFNGT